MLALSGCALQRPVSPSPESTPTAAVLPTRTIGATGSASSPPSDSPPTNTATLVVATLTAQPTDESSSQAPTGGPPTAIPVASHQLDEWRTIPYADRDDCGARLTVCQQFTDVYAPDDPGPWPVVVMVHGRPRTPSDMAELARAVA